MPPKGQKKAKEDNGRTTGDDTETNLDEISLKPFKRLMLSKLDRLETSMKDMVENVSKLTNHISKTDVSAVVEIMKDTSKQSIGLLKEVSETLKEMAKETTVINQRQPQALQEEST